MKLIIENQNSLLKKKNNKKKQDRTKLGVAAITANFDSLHFFSPSHITLSYSNKREKCTYYYSLIWSYCWFGGGMETVVICLTLFSCWFFFLLKVLSPELLAFHGLCTASATSIICGGLSSIRWASSCPGSFSTSALRCWASWGPSGSPRCTYKWLVFDCKTTYRHYEKWDNGFLVSL